jgi:SOS-response transcriptional repressor LexA
MRELADAVGLASPSSVHHHVQVLARRGLVEHRKGAPRTLRARHRQDAEHAEVASASS